MTSHDTSSELDTPPIRKRWWLLIVLPIWVLFSFVAAQLVVLLVTTLLSYKGFSLASLNGAVANSILAGITYSVALAIAVGVPFITRIQQVTKRILGVQQWPLWLDIILAVLGLVVYMILSSAFMYIAAKTTSIDFNQVQDTGFSNITSRTDLLLAFITLVIIAPIAEELLFRGYLFGQLKRHVPWWLAGLATSALFAFVHGQWNVAIDVFALSIVLCVIRQVTGRIWAGVLIHMLKNAIAFTIIFISPSLLGIIIK